MSADNWGVCPKCKKVNDKKNKERILDVAKKINKISNEEYIRLSAEANIAIALKNTLRESYKIGIDDAGIFYVIYSGQCSVCGFEFKYEERRDTNQESKT